MVCVCLCACVCLGGHLILTLDHSSTMALVQLEMLNQLEKVTGKRIGDIFEWIVASGVGGFLMMAMVYGKHLKKFPVEGAFV